MFPTDPTKYEITSTIGRGTHSKIYRAKCITNGQNVALKVVDLDSNPLEFDLLVKQTAFWSRLKHEKILSYYGSFISKSELWIITESMGGGSLSDILKFGHGSGIKDESIIAEISKSILKALCYLHKNKEIHRDVQSGNVLINSRGEVKLSDFGIATSLFINGNVRKEANSVYGDPCCMPPEMLTSGSGYTEKTDIWGLGLCILELATGKKPYEGMKTMESVLEIVTKEPPSLPKEGFSPSIRNFVSLCLQFNPEKRPSAEELLEHKFIKTASGAGPIITKIILKLAPLEQRYTMLYGNTQEKNVPKSMEKFVFDFDVTRRHHLRPTGAKKKLMIQREQPKSDSQTNEKTENHHMKITRSHSITIETEMIRESPPQENTPVVEKRGRFSIQRINSKSSELLPVRNNEGDSKEIVQIKGEIGDLKKVVSQLETDNHEMQKKVQEIMNLVKKHVK